MRCSIVVAGELNWPQLPESLDENAFVDTALRSRPEIRAVQAQAAGSRAAVDLARAERIPSPSIGPLYEKDESNVSFYGVGVSSAIPILNAGGRMVRQRESEHRRDVMSVEQTRQKVVLQVRNAPSPAAARPAASASGPRPSPRRWSSRPPAWNGSTTRARPIW